MEEGVIGEGPATRGLVAHRLTLRNRAPAALSKAGPLILDHTRCDLPARLVVGLPCGALCCGAHKWVRARDAAVLETAQLVGMEEGVIGEGPATRGLVAHRLTLRNRAPAALSKAGPLILDHTRRGEVVLCGRQSAALITAPASNL